MENGKMYICIDLKSFYASVECADRGLDPLKARLVVADESRTDKTICLAVSPALKAYGISGRARLFEVKSQLEKVRIKTGKTVDYIIAPPRMGRYMEVSSKIRYVYYRYVAPEDLHVYSVDEVFIDVTDYLRLYRLSARQLASKMIKDVLSETGITATVGIGTNLYLAKIAMDIVAKKAPADEDGVRIAELDERSYREILWSHTPLTDFWRIGRGTSAKLIDHGMYTMGDVARQSLRDEEVLYRLFGIDAEILIDHAWGYEPCTMKAIKSYIPETTSLSSGQVLPTPYTFRQAGLIVREMADMLSLDLVAKRLVTPSLTLYIGYDRSAFSRDEYDPTNYRDIYRHGAHGSISLGTPTASSVRIRDAASDLYEKITDRDMPIRRINICANNTEPDSAGGVQMDLFDMIDDKGPVISSEEENELQKTMLDIKSRYGANAIVRGMNLLEGGRTIERNKQIGGHKA
ncbi:MAG: DNA methylase [Clostridiales bacterium]|nr:DNA methylase [Clostridiales bacterium]